MKLFSKTCAGSLVALAGMSIVVPVAAAAGLAAPVETVRYDPHGARICSPLVAMAKARDTGMRHAEISTITAHRVVVTGRNRHGPERMVFANLPGCPVLRR